MKLTNLKSICLIIMMSMPVFASAETKVIAHRGFWKTEGSAQNSITALKKAAEINVYGSEFDVLITSDGIPVVNHDDTIEGFVIEKTPYDKIKNLKLKNGETLPTLKEYLIEGKKHPNLKLVLEIKPHSNDETDIKAARIIDKMVKDMNLQNQVDYISFSKTICKELGKLTPSSNIAYLMGDIAPSDIKELGINGIDYYKKVLSKNPEWISQAKQNNVLTNVWTVNSDDKIKYFVDKNIDFITTDEPLKALEIIRSAK